MHVIIVLTNFRKFLLAPTKNRKKNIHAVNILTVYHIYVHNI